MKWIWTYPVVCVYVTAGWELLLGEVVCKSRGYISCICNLRYTACNARAPYCHLWPLRLYHILKYYLINGTILEKKIIKPAVCVVNFSKTFV